MSDSEKLIDLRTGAYIEVYMDGGPNAAPHAEHFDISNLPIGVPVRLTAGEALRVQMSRPTSGRCTSRAG